MVNNLAKGDFSDADLKHFADLSSQIDEEINGVTIKTEDAEQVMKRLDLAYKDLSDNIKRGKLVDQNPTGINIKSSEQYLQKYISNLKGISTENVKIENSSKIAFGNSSEQIRQVNALIANQDGTWQKLTYSINATTGQVRELSNGVREYKQNSEDMINEIAGLLAAAGIAKGIKEIKEMLWSCVDAAVEFEKNMAAVKRTVGGTDSEIADMGDEFIKLSETIPLAAKEFATLASTAGQLGIRQ